MPGFPERHKVLKQGLGNNGGPDPFGIAMRKGHQITPAILPGITGVLGYLFFNDL